MSLSASGSLRWTVGRLADQLGFVQLGGRIGALGHGDRLQHGHIRTVVHDYATRLMHVTDHVHNAGPRDHDRVAGENFNVALGGLRWRRSTA